MDPERVVGPRVCGQCHVKESVVWRNSRHQTSWKEMHRSEEARAIAEKLVITGSIRNTERCVACHFTVRVKRERPRAIAGVSCESCHGPAKEWLPIHNNFGGPRIGRHEESKVHKAWRMATCEKLGRIHPSQVYQLAANCLACHCVSDHDLVELGGHSVGSGFELASWSQGGIRHNFLNTADGSNRVSEAPRRRVLYIVGTLVDLEYSLRGGVADRVETLKKRLRAIADRLQTQELEIALAAIDSNDPDIIQEIAKDFAAGNEGTKLAAIDPLIPEPLHRDEQPLSAFRQILETFLKLIQ